MWRCVKGLWVARLTLVAFTLTLAACGGQPRPSVSRSHATPTPSRAPQPALVPQPTPLTTLLDPIQAGCKQVAPPRTAQFGPALGFTSQTPIYGTGPAWMTSGLDNLSLESEGFQALPSTKMLWAIGPNPTQAVTISGHDLVSGTPMWIEIYGRTSYTTSASLLVGQSNRGSGMAPDGARWEIWGTGLIFLKSGCYQMTVSWPGGHWQTTFAVGR